LKLGGEAIAVLEQLGEEAGEVTDRRLTLADQSFQ
jgi:hypothetical protein